MRFQRLLMLLSEGSSKDLRGLFQTEYLKEIGKTDYKSLSDEGRKLLDLHVARRVKEVESQVEGLSDDPQYRSWVYDMLKNRSVAFPEDISKTKEVLKIGRAHV